MPAAGGRRSRSSRRPPRLPPLLRLAGTGDGPRGQVNYRCCGDLQVRANDLDGVMRARGRAGYSCQGSTCVVGGYRAPVLGIERRRLFLSSVSVIELRRLLCLG